MKKSFLFALMLIVSLLITTYLGYFYAWVIEEPKAYGGVLKEDGWLMVKMDPTIPLPWFNFYRATKVDDYWLMRDHREYIKNQCCNRILMCE